MQDLVNRIRIEINPKKLMSFSEKKMRYYEDYASFVSHILKEPSFQRNLHSIMREEGINECEIKDVQIRFFPYVKKNGKTLAGKCTSRGEIKIYPQRMSFIHKVLKKWKKERFNYYVKSRAKAALIHEILHLKYREKEELIRELTKKYMKPVIQKRRLSPKSDRSIKSLVLSEEPT
jgi:hypothetical protein